ncbi:MAG: DciA family protein [Alphaproteobacteria bacterium]|nr:DciA family protein [Alphaproteobacteria bacterium]
MTARDPSPAQQSQGSLRGKTRRGLTTLGQSVDRVTGPALRRRGFAEAAIVTRWDEIVGRPLCDHSRPFRVVFPRGERRGGTLHLTVSGAFAPEVEHLSPQIIERINIYFGYRAVEQLRLHHGRISPRPTAGKPAAGDPAAAAAPDNAVKRRLQGVADPGLRAALTRLAGARAADRAKKD